MVRFARPVSICESCRWYEPLMEMEGPHVLREPIFTPACRAYPGRHSCPHLRRGLRPQRGLLRRWGSPLAVRSASADSTSSTT